MQRAIGIDRDLRERARELDRVVDARAAAQLSAPALEPAQRPDVEGIRPLRRDQRQEAQRQREVERPRALARGHLRDRDRELELATIEVGFELAHGTVWP